MSFPLLASLLTSSLSCLLSRVTSSRRLLLSLPSLAAAASALGAQRLRSSPGSFARSFIYSSLVVAAIVGCWGKSK